MANSPQNDQLVSSTRRMMVSTIAAHDKEIQNAAMRSFVILEQLMAMGRIMFNVGGLGLTWRVKYRHAQMSKRTGTGPRTAARNNYWKTASLGDDSGYEVTDSITRKELDRNRNEEALINVFDQMKDNLVQSLEDQIPRELMEDGYASGRERSFHGLKSVIGTPTQTITLATGVARAKNVGDRYFYPEATYAGIATTLAAAGGGSNSAGAVWPEGRPDVNYDFWTPVAAVANSTNFGGTTHTFQAQGLEVIRDIQTYLNLRKSKRGQATHVMLNPTWYKDLKNALDGKQQINIVPSMEEKGSLYNLGYSDVIRQDGLEIFGDNVADSEEGFVYNPANLEFRCINDKMFKMHEDDIDYDWENEVYRMAMVCDGDLVMRCPRNFGFLLTV